MGFRDLRVRLRGNDALVQISGDQFGMAAQREKDITEALSDLYEEVRIDGNPRVSR